MMADRELRLGRKVITIPETALDRVIEWAAPQWAERRLRSRMAMAVSGAYHGGKSSRRALSEWKPQGGSADADTLDDLPSLRERSRDLVRNAPIAGGAIATVVSNVAGTGLTLQSTVDAEALGLSDDEASAWQSDVERRWRLWSESTSCDVTRRQTFYGLQSLALRTALESGDVFVLTPMLRRPGLSAALALQLIEADRVCNKDFTPDTAQRAGGVEMDSFGAPVAYHVLRQHPGDLRRLSLEWDRVPAYGSRTQRRNALHLYTQLRPAQTRGVPYLAAVIEPLKQLERYTDAEIMAAVVAGMFSVFVKSEGDGLSPLDSAIGANTGNGTAAAKWDGKLGNGLVIDLAAGESIETADPGRPNANFDPFVSAIIKQIGMALELPFEVLMKHFSSSYSASRAAMLDAWRFFRNRRDWLAEQLCRPVYELWLDDAVASGAVAAPGYFADPLVRKAYLGARWVGDAPGSIDPAKDATAAEKRLEIGVSTLASESIAYDGVDWLSKHRQQVKERQARKEGGLVQPDPTPASNAPPQREREDDAQAAAPAPVFNFTLPEVRIENHQPAPVVHSTVTTSPTPRATRTTVEERDVDGLIIATRTETIDEATP